MFSTRRSCSHCGMTRSGAVMIASDLVPNPASVFVGLRNGILTCFSPPLPPAAALSWPCLLSAWSGLWRAPPLFCLSFSSLFLLSGFAPGFARFAVCLTVEVGTHFGSRRIAILFSTSEDWICRQGVRTKPLQHSCATPPKSS